jgi:hypothetical protein
MTILARVYKANYEGIRRVVFDLAASLTKNPGDADLVVDLFHRDLQIALHCDSEKMWKRAKWK